MKRLYSRMPLLAVCMAAVILFAGCSYGQSGVEALLKPPKLSGEQSEIYNALLANVAGKNVRLQYPRKGDFTSAFVLHNMDNEPTEEAVVFYASGTDGSMRLNILDREEGQWVSKYDIPCPRSSSEVDKVAFITGGDIPFLLVGYTIGGESGKSLRIYSYEDGKLEEKAPVSCMDFEVFDLNGDGEDELVTLSQKMPMGDEGSLHVLAECGTLTPSGQFKLDGSTEMDPVVDRYPNILRGILVDGRPALYLDGVRENSLWSTEILAYEGRILRNYIYDPDSELNLVSRTLRDAGIASYNLEEDQVIHIPVRLTVPNYEDAQKSQQEVFTEWYIYNPRLGTLVLRKTTYVSYSLGYIFEIPRGWVGYITLEFDSAENILNFYEYNRGEDDPIGDELLSIKLVRRSNLEHELQDNGYSILRDMGQNIYLYQIYNTGSTLPPIEADQVQTAFQLYAN